MSANLPNLPRTSTPDLSRLRRLTPVRMMDPATSGFIDILVSTNCVPTIDRLLPPERQAALARLIAAHPEVAKTLGEVEGGQDKQLSYQGLIVNFWDIRCLGHIIIYHLEKEDDTPPSGPPDKKLNPYFGAAIGATIGAIVREIAKRLPIPDIFQHYTTENRRHLNVNYAILCVSRNAISPRLPAANVLCGKEKNTINVAGCEERIPCELESNSFSWEIRRKYIASMKYSCASSTNAVPFIGAPSFYLGDWIIEGNFSQLSDNSCLRGILMKGGIGMLNSRRTDRTVALRNAIAELRAHIAGTQNLRGFTVLENPTVDVRSIRVLAKCSPQRFAVLLQISLDTLIAWECGEAHPNADQVHLLSLMEFYPEEVIRELEIVESPAPLH